MKNIFHLIITAGLVSMLLVCCQPLYGKQMVAIGNSNAEIGRALFVSEATVKTHLLRIFTKLEVSDRTAAVTTAMSLGLLPGPQSPGNR